MIWFQRDFVRFPDLIFQWSIILEFHTDWLHSICEKVGHIQSEKANSCCAGSSWLCSCWLENQSSIFFGIGRRRLCYRGSIDHFYLRSAPRWSWEFWDILRLILKLYYQQELRSFAIAFLWSAGAGLWTTNFDTESRIWSRSYCDRDFVEFDLLSMLWLLKVRTGWSESWVKPMDVLRSKFLEIIFAFKLQWKFLNQMSFLRKVI